VNCKRKEYDWDMTKNPKTCGVVFVRAVRPEVVAWLKARAAALQISMSAVARLEFERAMKADTKAGGR